MSKWSDLKREFCFKTYFCISHNVVDWLPKRTFYLRLLTKQCLSIRATILCSTFLRSHEACGLTPGSPFPGPLAYHTAFEEDQAGPSGCSDLEQCEWIVLQLWRPELKCRWWQPHMETLRKNPFSCLLHLPEASCFPWLMAPCSVFKASHSELRSCTLTPSALSILYFGRSLSLLWSHLDNPV